MTAEILAVAGAHVARDGAAALSLRSIARDLGMAPSALYRYFDGRDALLSALILAAYEALAAEAERAADRARRPPGSGGLGATTPNAGCPCPAPCGLGPGAPSRVGAYLRHPGAGYEAPEDTVEPYARASLRRWCVPLIEHRPAGRLRIGPTPEESLRRIATRWHRWPTGSFPTCPSTRSSGHGGLDDLVGVSASRSSDTGATPPRPGALRRHDPKDIAQATIGLFEL